MMYATDAKRRPARSSQRSGSILLIVVGLVALLLAIFTVVVSQVRNEAVQASDVVRDAQARLMLPAALAFILESARLGNHEDGETLGWTDAVDGGVGPKVRGAAAPTPAANQGHLPSGRLTPAGGTTANQWPLPGSVYRADMYAWAEPRYAVKPLLVPNPIEFPPEWLEEYEEAPDRAAKQATILGGILHPTQAGNGTGWGILPDDNQWTADPNGFGTSDPTYKMAVPNDVGLAYHWGRVWSRLFEGMTQGDPKFARNLHVQAVADDYTSFETGDPTPIQASTGRAWFRIYREAAADHDGDDSPFYDRAPLSGHGVFIVTVGAGGTLGYRGWAEVPAADRNDFFLGSEEVFDQLRARERILWYRVAWSGFTGGVGNAHARYARHSRGYTDGQVTDEFGWSPGPVFFQTAYAFNNAALHQGEGPDDWDVGRAPVHPNCTGTIEWIEFLEQEPPVW